MGVLNWTKPAKKLSPKEWANSYGFEEGPTGGYVPNMSDEDMKRIKPKLIGKTTDHPQIELRKTFGAQLIVIVSLGNGYNYKGFKADSKKDDWKSGQHTKGFNIHWAANGPIQMTFAEMDEIYAAIAEAKEVLTTRTINGNPW
jgi:hypothetical protein